MAAVAELGSLGLKCDFLAAIIFSKSPGPLGIHRKDIPFRRRGGLTISGPRDHGSQNRHDRAHSVELRGVFRRVASTARLRDVRDLCRDCLSPALLPFSRTYFDVPPSRIRVPPVLYVIWRFRPNQSLEPTATR